MRAIRTSGSMRGERKRGDAEWPQPPRLSSTLPKQPNSDRPFRVRCNADSRSLRVDASLDAVLVLMGNRRGVEETLH